MNIGPLRITLEEFTTNAYFQELAKAIAHNLQGSKIHWN